MEKGMNEAQLKSPDEIEQLKRDWVADPTWDIEYTEGFEAHRDELAKFAKDHRESLRIRREKEIAAGMSRYECSRETYLHIESIEAKVDQLESKLDRALELLGEINGTSIADAASRGRS